MASAAARLPTAAAEGARSSSRWRHEEPQPSARLQSKRVAPRLLAAPSEAPSVQPPPEAARATRARATPPSTAYFVGHVSLLNSGRRARSHTWSPTAAAPSPTCHVPPHGPNMLRECHRSVVSTVRASHLATHLSSSPCASGCVRARKAPSHARMDGGFTLACTGPSQAARRPASLWGPRTCRRGAAGRRPRATRPCCRARWRRPPVP